MMRYLWTICLVFVIGACKTIHDDNSSKEPSTKNDDTVNLTSSLPPDLATMFGQKSQIVCTMDYNPTRCYARTQNGQEFIEARRPVTWGPNRCAAERQFKDDGLGGIECTPDVSQEFCGKLVKDCEGSSESHPMTCYYDDTFIVANSKCEAKYLLQNELCKHNMLTEKIDEDKIICADITAEDLCEPKASICVDEYEPTICKTDKEIPNIPAKVQSVFARNRCLAENTLMQNLCSRGINAEKNIVCKKDEGR